MSNYSQLKYQQTRIEKYYNCFRCDIDTWGTDELICKAELQPLDSTDKYKVEIKQRAGRKPVVRILSPKIEPSSKIHTYRDGSLCLYYPGDMTWKPSTLIAEHTIPWIVEWILYYEIYKISGKWEGKEAPHLSM